MSRFEETTLTDSAGNEIGSHIQADGDYHLGTTITQSVDADVLNSSTTNLTAITPTIWTFTSGKLFELPTTIDFFGLPFSNGLRLYVTAQDACVTVIYE